MRIAPLLVLPVLACTCAVAAAAVPAFSSGEPGAVPAGWSATTLRNRAAARFEIVATDNERVLQADARAAVGALVYEVDAEPAESTMLTWRWRIANHVPGSDMRTRAGDDFPARVYVTFARDPGELGLSTRLKLALARLLYGQRVPAAGLCYVWARDLPVGTAMPNAYTDTVMMVVAESGGAEPSGWVAEAHDFRADYRRLFGGEPPPVTSVVVAIDTDDTGATARAWFGDVAFVRGPAAPQAAESAF